MSEFDFYYILLFDFQNPLFFDAEIDYGTIAILNDVFSSIIDGWDRFLWFLMKVFIQIWLTSAHGDSIVIKKIRNEEKKCDHSKELAKNEVKIKSNLTCENRDVIFFEIEWKNWKCFWE